jgi:pyridoxine 4-dehydrogenase
VLSDLLREGKVRAVGLSEVSVEEIEAARHIVDVVTVQNRYNATDRYSEDVLDYCAEQGIGFIPWFPVASGALAQPGGALDSLAKANGVTVAQLSLAWLLQRSPVMLPIPGTSKVAHLEENCAAVGITLDRQTVDVINALA